MRILIGLALLAASVAASPASANGGAATMRVSNSSGQMASAANSTHRVSQSEAQERSRVRRENTYRAYYHRKFGTKPTDSQVDSWYAHAYRHQP